MSNLTIGLVIVFLGLTIGAGLLFLAQRTRAQVEAAARWTEVPAVIEAVRIKRIGKSMWAPDLTYSYAVAGRSYTGNRLQFGSPSMSRPEAEAMIQHYAVGTTTTARYDPARHDFAVLRLDGDSRSLRFAGVALAIVFAVCGLIVAFTG